MRIPDEAWPYLHIQRGDLYNLRPDPAAWAIAYFAGLSEWMKAATPYLPVTNVERIMDIGGGVGGLASVLCNHYDNVPEAVIVDGARDLPEVVRHSQTFNDFRATRAMLNANGVKRYLLQPPDETLEVRPCQLVVSTRAWCFHVPPIAYLEYVRKCLLPGSVIILDVRFNTEWRHALKVAFGDHSVLHTSDKFSTLAWRLP